MSANLAERLRARIAREGPISFHDWMKAALYDESEGYYSVDRLRQGRTGDYRTAPETSPLFAATFARYFSKLHTDLKWPAAWTILEVGGSGGEFAHGVLSQLCAHYPEIFANTRYIIDEASQSARARAAERLTDFAERMEFRRLEEMTGPIAAGIIFSNELIDAFPIHRVIMSSGLLRELYVGAAETGFTWVEGDLTPAVAEYCQRTRMQLAESQFAEVNLEAEIYLQRAARLLEKGYVITVDYGAERHELWSSPHRREGTLRAFRRHQLADDLLARPGEQDLTSTIDWTQMMEVGQRAGLQTIRFQPLNDFLSSEGIYDLMLEMVNNTSDPVAAIRITTGMREMVLPNRLASSFQVLVQEKV